MIVLSAGIRSLLWNSQRSGPESASRGTCYPGRDHPGMVGDIISERWAELSRNGWAASFRNHGRLAPESTALNGHPQQRPGRQPPGCPGRLAWLRGNAVADPTLGLLPRRIEVSL